ncbi:unnamed protein product [Dibothriocephalus latus]|uniref:BOP1 N-terminal domain-containing protein n=1 Tax=Dibothriocephalus latus TaxID=60516 RepID=A0A3P7NGR1_DIBLA|nr:unnamed protein product [Dibothriocephalus latus]
MVPENSYPWQAGLPASLQTYRPPRPRPYMRPASEPLPSHAESYNPPPEFLLSSEEERAFIRAWRDKVKDNQAAHVMPLLPRKYDCLRHVPFCERYLREREERIKDLVMAARVEKQQVHTTPEALLPEIPSLADLRPYPSHQGLEYRSPHAAKQTNVAAKTTGLLRRKKTVPASDAVKAEGDTDEQRDEEEDDEEEEEESQVPYAFVAWNPNHELHLVAAAM